MNDYLIHFGIPGQKWGERRFQNEDGTLTPAGRQKATSILTAAAAVASAATLGVGVHYNPYYNIPGVKYKATYGDHPMSIGAPYEELKNKKRRKKH